VAFRLVEVLPDSAAKIEVLFRRRNERTIADCVAALEMVAPCRCDNVACGGFWTRDPGDERIAHLEVLDREEVREASRRRFASA
jgi:hypothetical protein